jgi:hypothetical protein
MAKTKVVITGPMFDGQAEAAARAYAVSLPRELALIAQTWIKTEASTFDKSGRGGTGEAAEGVMLTGAGTTYTVSGGIRAGRYAWPWLEGISKRNQSTGFKGYKTFSRTRGRMKKQATPYAQQLLSRYLEQMGGGEE